MPLSPPVRAVIFDMDGVLLDTEPLYTRAVAEIVGAYGKTFDWSVKRRMMGRGPLEGAELVIAELGLPISPEEFIARMDPVLVGLFGAAPAMPGAPELVAELSARGVRLAIATSSRAQMFRLKTAPHRWFSAFEAVVCGDDPSVLRFKPAPDIYLVAAERLRLAPSECLVVEDAPAGVAAAKAAGMLVFALPAPELGEGLLGDADRVLGDYAELRLALLDAV